jgi:hypothetical protein
VRDDVARLHLPDDIGHISPHRLVVRHLTIAIGREHHLGSYHRSGEQSFAPLLRAVDRRCQPRVAAFSERHVENHDAIAAFCLLDEQRPGGQLHVAGVSPYRENRPPIGPKRIGRRRLGAAGANTPEHEAERR